MKHSSNRAGSPAVPLLLRILILATALILPLSGIATGQEKQAGTPDREQIEFYRDYAVIATQCQSWPEAYALAQRIRDRGGIVSVLVTPGCFLGWVPEAARNPISTIENVSTIISTPVARKTAATGPDAEQIDAAFDHFRLAKSGLLQSSPSGIGPGRPDDPLDNTGVEALRNFARVYEKTGDSAATAQGQSPELWRRKTQDSAMSLLGIPPGDMNGVINVDVFMMESHGSSSVYNWTSADYNTVVNDWYAAFDFWTLNAARYGRGLSFRASWYSPFSNTAMRVSYEPIRVEKENDWRLVKQVLENLGYTEPFGDLAAAWVGAIFSLGACIPCDMAITFDLMSDGSDKEFIRAMKWNDKRAGDLGVHQSYCAFMKLRPAGSTDNKRAYCRVASTGFTGGVLDLGFLGSYTTNICIGAWVMIATNKGPAVYAHETGHVFGAPDEYKENAGDTDCAQPGFRFRGIGNPNCEATNTNSVTAMMRNNSTGNINYNQYSSATPIHIGWVGGAARTIRFRTNPSGVPMTLPIGITGGETFTGTKDLYMALGYTIPSASVPASHTIGATTYYFEGWYEDGDRVIAGTTRSITIGSSVSEYEARYTSSAAGINTANNSLEARFGVGIPTGSPSRQWAPGIVLVWNSTLTEPPGGYIVQWDNSGTWEDVPSLYTVVNLAPRFCYSNVANIGGPLTAGRTYRLRVVPINRFSVRGTPSNAVSITMRPSTPASGTYGYDGQEANNTTATATSYTIAAATTTTIDAAVTFAQPAEFGFEFDDDYYSFQASDMGMEELDITLSVKPGSNFEPLVSYRPSGSSIWTEVRRTTSGQYVIVRRNSGTYTVKVTSKRSSGDLIDSESGVGHWGEYTIEARRRLSTLVQAPGLCFDCSSIQRISSGGSIYPLDLDPASSRIFTSGGRPITSPAPVKVEGVPDPGYEFVKWEGAVEGTPNPIPFTLERGKNAPGELMLIAYFNKLPEGTFELVFDVPKAYESILGESKRYRGKYGDIIDVALPDGALNGFDFLGWQGPIGDDDVVEPEEWHSSPSLRIRLTRNMWIRPFIRPRPCTGEGLKPFVHSLFIQNAKDESLTLTYGMQPGASDSLEAGQIELPPPPVLGVMDARFMAIAGAAQGSLTDIRGMKPSFTYAGRMQPGENGDPVLFRWNPIPASTPGTFIFTVGALKVDMRQLTEVRMQVGSVGTFLITVTEDTCRELPRGNVNVEVTDVDPTGFPYIRGRICVTDKDGNPILTIRPPDVLLYEQRDESQGGNRRAHLISLRPENACYRFEGFVEDDKPHDEDNKNRGIRVVVASNLPRGEGDGGNNFPIPTTPAVPDTLNGNGRPNTAYYSAHEAGWQLVSLPIMVSDPSVLAVYGAGLPDGRVYGFDPDKGYFAAGNMTFGRGYWARFSAADTRRLNGLERTQFEYKGLPGIGQSVANGWNLIGAITYEVPRSSIAESPAGAIVSLFEFDAGYKTASVLKPGAAYWIKLLPDAVLNAVRAFRGSSDTITLTGGRTPYDRLLASLPRRCEFTLTAADGASSTLFTTNAGLPGDMNEAIGEMPPLPPSSAFDARFIGNRVYTADDEDLLVRTQGVFPIKLEIRADASSAALYRIERSDGSLLAEIDGRAGGTAVASAPDEGNACAMLNVRKILVAREAAPLSCSLGQIYPNPLSRDARLKSASISFQVDSPADVEISVFDALGRLAATVTRGRYEAGAYAIQWNGRASNGALLPAGCYFVEFRAAGVRQVKNILIAK